MKAACNLYVRVGRVETVTFAVTGAGAKVASLEGLEATRLMLLVEADNQAKLASAISRFEQLEGVIGMKPVPAILVEFQDRLAVVLCDGESTTVGRAVEQAFRKLGVSLIDWDFYVEEDNGRLLNVEKAQKDFLVLPGDTITVLIK